MAAEKGLFKRSRRENIKKSKTTKKKKMKVIKELTPAGLEHPVPLLSDSAR
jgi:hypothetical protein